MRWMPLALLLAYAPVVEAAAQSGPVERAGEWITTMTMVMPGGESTAGHPITLKMCRSHDRALDAKTMADLISRHQGNCSQHDSTLTDSGGTFAFTCSMHGMTVHAHGEIARLADQGISTHVVSHSEGGPQGMPHDMEMTMTARYGGPCQPGDTPVAE